MIIGFIGLGIMGESMCENLIKKRDNKILVFDVASSQVEKLVALGAQGCDSSYDLALKADIIISMVPKSSHVKNVFEEIKPALKNGKIWVDMSTIEPDISAQIAQQVNATGAIMLDAPVVKSKAAAISGNLGIYVGGDVTTYEKVKDILLCMGSNIIHMGKNGMGLYMKIAHNMLVGQIQNGVNEMYVFAEKAGLDLHLVAPAISYGGGQNFYLDGKANSILQGDFTTAFSVENMSKDVDIAVDVKNKFHLELNGFDLIKKIYDAAMGKGLGKEDFSATFKIVDKAV